MLGHSFGSDVTNGVYGHRTLEELRAEIEKIEVHRKSGRWGRKVIYFLCESKHAAGGER